MTTSEARGTEAPSGAGLSDPTGLPSGEGVSLRQALEIARDELKRWGWGDFHYGEQPQDPVVLAAISIADKALATAPQEEPRAGEVDTTGVLVERDNEPEAVWVVRG